MTRRTRELAPLRFPLLYLLSSPLVVLQQLRERRRRVEIVCFENRAASAGNIAELEVPLQKPFDGRLVGRVEHRPAGPPAPGDFKTQGECGETIEVGGFELELKSLLPVKPRTDSQYAV